MRRTDNTNASTDVADSAARFYDDFADCYHLLFADWRETVRDEGNTLHGLIQQHLPGESLRVLDCSCGIGTQAIGLALHGYRVLGTDISEKAVERARREAVSFGVSPEFHADDLRFIGADEGIFDVVLSWGNSFPHLITDEDLLRGAKSMASRLKPGGLLLIGTRDYDMAASEMPRFVSPTVFEGKDGKRVVFQVWDWAPDRRTYTVNQFIVCEMEKGWQTLHDPAQYRVLKRDELEAILTSVGLVDIHWHETDQSGYPEPIATARKE